MATLLGPISSAGIGPGIPRCTSSFTRQSPVFVYRVSCILQQWSAPWGLIIKPSPSPSFARGSCIPASSPFTWMENSSALPPILCAARAAPSASRSPIPSRLATSSMTLSMASALPNLNSMPLVSPVLSSPFSKHSIAKEMTAPIEMVSNE